MSRKLDPKQFVEFFIEKNKNLIKSLSKRYIIPNRYSYEDVLQYIAVTILHIMTKRQSSSNPIEDPEKYFSGCLVYYMIEYQRLNGFVFGLPKRPRRDHIEQEKEAKARKFQYIDDTILNDRALTHDGYFSKKEPKQSKLWKELLKILNSQDVPVIDCIFSKNMTLLETSNYLNVAQSTCLNRRDRALKTIFNYFDLMPGEMKLNVKKFIKQINKKEKTSEDYE